MAEQFSQRKTGQFWLHAASLITRRVQEIRLVAKEQEICLDDKKINEFIGAHMESFCCRNSSYLPWAVCPEKRDKRQTLWHWISRCRCYTAHTFFLRNRMIFATYLLQDKIEGWPITMYAKNDWTVLQRDVTWLFPDEPNPRCSAAWPGGSLPSTGVVSFLAFKLENTLTVF